MVKLPGELFASMGSDFDTTIKFNASTGEEYFDQLHVVPKSLQTQSWFASYLFSLFSRHQQAGVGSFLRAEETPLCNRPSETVPSGLIQSTQW